MSDFWQRYQNEKARNHVALMLAVRGALRAAEHGEVMDRALQARLREALKGYDNVQRMLREHVGEVA